MFTQPVSSPPPGPTTTSPVTPSRPSRLRGLSYLRNYTQNHLLSRDTPNQSNTTAGGSNSPGPQPGILTRSVSYSPATSTPSYTTNDDMGRSNRLTLVSQPNEGLLRPPTQPRSASVSHVATISSDRSEDPSLLSPASAADTSSNMMQSRSGPVGEVQSPGADTTPSIRFSAYYDPRSTRPSLSFPPVSRTLPNGNEVIRVGRYSERDTGASTHLPGGQPSAAPVGFKSKVVSRRHCEFWNEDGKWYIKDVKSSSGTFLNHIRLSPPSQESKAFPVNDGDIVQLGIDFKGGEEMIFRCVKMRLELNRGWQNKLNTFNMAAHKRLRTMANGGGAAPSGSTSQDCSICLNSIAPCQSLFVAPCSHTWHFKCVRSLLHSPQYPIFICPNCRAGADLEADVDEPAEDWEALPEINEEGVIDPTDGTPDAAAPGHDVDPMDVTVSVNAADSSAGQAGASHSATQPIPIHNAGPGSTTVNHTTDSLSPPSPPHDGPDGPITPRNNAGPWVFDGGAGHQQPADSSSGMQSIDAATTEMDTST